MKGSFYKSAIKDYIHNRFEELELFTSDLNSEITDKASMYL